jgi:hypothetical protein
MVRINLNRLLPIMAELLRQSQFYGVTGRTIFEALASMREAIAQAEITRVLLCILFLGIQEAYDRISHQYQFSILKSNGISD